MVFQEALLHFIWRYRLFDVQNLKTVSGEKVFIYDIGQYNQNSGPDFTLAKLKIGSTLWSGNVEIHVKEEEWLLHKHHLDPSYDNTILHVVWGISGRSILRSDGTPIPTLKISDYVDTRLLECYVGLMNNLDWIPCVNQLTSVRELTVQTWLNRMTVERLEQKVSFVERVLIKTSFDWEYVFFLLLGRSFGAKVNAEAFEVLCLNLNLQILNKYRQDYTKVESIIFGVAGFLENPVDEYSSLLQKEFSYLQGLHNLNKMEVGQWRFLRMRPYNFPTFRIAQFVALLQFKTSWFSYILNIDHLQDAMDAIDKSIVNSYWKNHYRFDVPTKIHSIGWSSSFKNHLAINCFVPLLFTYGDYMNNEAYKEKALSWLNELPAEVNQITKKYAAYHVTCQNAADSQALLHLNTMYCVRKQCLDCAVGLEILKRH